MPDPIEDDHRTVRFATHLAEVHEVAKIDLADHAAVWYTRHESAAMVQDFWDLRATTPAVVVSPEPCGMSGVASWWSFWWCCC